MSKSWPASLMIAVFVSAALLALYQATGYFLMGAVWVESVLRKLIIIPQGELSFFKPFQYGYYTLAAFLTSYVCIEAMPKLAKVGYLLAALFLTILMPAALGLNGWLFEPFSGCIAILVTGISAAIYHETDDSW
jgi:hypothetical protein